MNKAILQSVCLACGLMVLIAGCQNQTSDKSDSNQKDQSAKTAQEDKSESNQGEVEDHKQNNEDSVSTDDEDSLDYKKDIGNRKVWIGGKLKKRKNISQDLSSIERRLVLYQF